MLSGAFRRLVVCLRVAFGSGLLLNSYCSATGLLEWVRSRVVRSRVGWEMLGALICLRAVFVCVVVLWRETGDLVVSSATVRGDVYLDFIRSATSFP